MKMTTTSETKREMKKKNHKMTKIMLAQANLNVKKLKNL